MEFITCCCMIRRLPSLLNSHLAVDSQWKLVLPVIRISPCILMWELWSDVCGLLAI
jgi:hypothetical protein